MARFYWNHVCWIMGYLDILLSIVGNKLYKDNQNKLVKDISTQVCQSHSVYWFDYLGSSPFNSSWNRLLCSADDLVRVFGVARFI